MNNSGNKKDSRQKKNSKKLSDSSKGSYKSNTSASPKRSYKSRSSDSPNRSHKSTSSHSPKRSYRSKSFDAPKRANRSSLATAFGRNNRSSSSDAPKRDFRTNSTDSPKRSYGSKFSRSTPRRNYRAVPGRTGPYSSDRSRYISAERRTPDLSPMIKKFSSLKKERGRLTHSKFLMEGEKIIYDIIESSPDIIDIILTTQDFSDKKFSTTVKKHHVRTKEITGAEMEALSDTCANQGVIAVVKYASMKPDWNVCRYITLMDGIQDPGNVGSIIRTSVALGMDAILFGKGTCDVYNPKVVRSSAGMFLKMPFESNVDLLSKITFLRQKGFTIIATSPHAHYTISQVKLRKRVALIVSNEGVGINELLSSNADSIVHIPLNNKADSLNVGVAHGIIAYELINSRS